MSAFTLAARLSRIRARAARHRRVFCLRFVLGRLHITHRVHLSALLGLLHAVLLLLSKRRDEESKCFLLEIAHLNCYGPPIHYIPVNFGTLNASLVFARLLIEICVNLVFGRLHKRTIGKFNICQTIFDALLRLIDDPTVPKIILAPSRSPCPSRPGEQTPGRPKPPGGARSPLSSPTVAGALASAEPPGFVLIGRLDFRDKNLK